MRFARLITFAIATLLFVSSAAFAQEIDRRQKPLAVFFDVEAPATRWIGKANAQTSWGLGTHLRQGLIVGPMSFWLRLGGNSWLTTQTGPPFQRGIRAFTTGFGVGSYREFGQFRGTAYGSYDIVNLSGNPLFDTLGSRSQFHALGAGIGASYHLKSPLFVELRAQGQHWFGAERSTQSIEFIFAVGIEASLRH